MTFHCRSCQSDRMRRIVDLGATPLANALLRPGPDKVAEKRYPLDLVVCQDCWLVQITETVPPDDLFSHYLYFSSFSDTAIENARSIVVRMIDRLALGPASLAMEAASNDGYLLRHYSERGIPVLGVEPARNIAEQANAAGIATRCSFFGAEEARLLAAEGLRCDAFHANNVLAHVPDLNGFVAGIATVLKPGGLASIEVPYLRDLIEHMEFDTIYHEHLCYFSVTALAAVFERHGLSLADVERIPIHGGSLRLFVAHKGNAQSDAVVRLLEEERQLGMTGFEFYADFASRIAALKHELTAVLHDLKRAGHRIAAYGASAKGATLLNTFGIGQDVLDFVADRSTVKQGLLTPGTHLPIVAPSELLSRQPDYLLLLTWNFADEILEQQHEYRARGGKVIIPVPRVRIV